MARGHAVRCLEMIVSITRTSAIGDATYQHLLGITNSPGQILDVAVCLDYFGCELNTKPNS